MRKLVDGLDQALSGIEYVLIAVLALSALALGTAQVLLRYAFNTGYTWSEAVFVLLTVSAMLMAGMRGVRDDVHVRVDLLENALPDPWRRAVRLVGLVAGFCLTLFLAWCGYLFVRFVGQMGLVSPDSGLPLWAINTIVPVTMAGFALRFALRIIRTLAGWETATTPHSVAEAD